MSKPGFRYYLVTDRRQSTRRPLTEAVEEACRRGIRAVQLREKDLPGRELYELAAELRRITSRWNASLLINDRADIAMAVDADGVQCPEAGLWPDDVSALDDRLLAGVSVHSVVAAQQAEKRGADFLLFGPVFRTVSKLKYGEPQGIGRLEEVVKAVRIPVYAIGGITSGRADACLQAGAYGVGGISSVLQADSVGHKVGEWEKALGGL